MAVKELALDTVALDRDVGDIRSCLAQVRAEAEAMFAAVTVLNRTWEGPAKEDFVTQFHADAALVERMLHTVSALADDMQRASATYKKAGQNVADAIDSIRLR